LASVGLISCLALAMTVRNQIAWHGHRRGEALMGEARWQEAIEAFKRADAWQPDDPEHVYGEALAVSRMAQSSSAWPLFVRAADLDPLANKYVAKYEAAKADWMARHGRMEEAEIIRKMME